MWRCEHNYNVFAAEGTFELGKHEFTTKVFADADDIFSLGTPLQCSKESYKQS